jgi:hypothetical protein
MRTFTIAVVIAFLTMPVYAAKLGHPSDEEAALEQQRRKNEEKAYQDALKSRPDQATKKNDPWGNVRSGAQPGAPGR